jgi:hypothetical protein
MAFGRARRANPALVKRWADEQGRRIEDFLLEGEEPIPFVVMRNDAAGLAGRKPVAFWQHGATGSRLANLDAMHRLCDAGYLVASVDQRLHGGRTGKMPPLGCGAAPRFEDTIVYIACGTSRDVALVLDYLETRADLQPDRIGWVGGSLGGLVGAILATREKRIKAVVSLIGGGAHRQLATVWAKGEPLREETDALLREFDPIDRVARLFPTAVLLCNGATDPTLTAAAAQAFCDAAQPFYAAAPDRLRLVVNPETGHWITEEAYQMTLEWLGRYV